ncbi:MAG: helix-hairpin-helix domain-containing protein [Paraclostridium sp.]
MKNIPKIMMIIVIVLIGGMIAMKNFNDLDNSYVVSDIENKDDNYTDKIINDNESSNMDNITVNETRDFTIDKITIYISGEVKNPGVVELNTENRLSDGVNLCGGLTDDANLNAINLAMKIQDEAHYIIPKIGDELISTNVDLNVENISTKNINKNEENNNENKININTATISELDTLPGFGEVTAQKIIDYREENTKFNSIEEIKNIKGIGEKKFNDVKDYICIQ